MLGCSDQTSTTQKPDLEDAWGKLPAMALDRWKRFAQRIMETAGRVEELGTSCMPDARPQ